MHFSRMGAYEDGAEVPIIVRGDGCYVFDQHGKRYLDGLSSLLCTNIGHSRAHVGPLPAGGCPVPNTNPYRRAEGHDPADLAEAIARRIEFEDPSTVSA